MKRLLSAGLLAFLIAVLITFLYPTRALDDQLLRLQVQQQIPEYATELSAEPAGLQALFLVYADDPVLLAKARLALLRYPEPARQILLMFGEDAVFQDVLRRYGEDVLLPIVYFLDNEVFTLELMRGMSETARSVFNTIRGVWAEEDVSESSAARGRLSPQERGWYAVHFIDTEGYDFIGQFVVAPDGKVGWIQTERMLEGINRFFAGGIKGLETKLRRDEAIAMSDVGWAAVDVAIGVSAFKILRMGRAGAASRSLTFSERSAAMGAGLWRGSVVGARMVKYGAPAVLAYMAIRHPTIIHSLLADAAVKLGLPVGVVQVVGWTLVLLPVVLVLRLLLAPLAWVLIQAAALLRWGGRALRAG